MARQTAGVSPAHALTSWREIVLCEGVLGLNKGARIEHGQVGGVGRARQAGPLVSAREEGIEGRKERECLSGRADETGAIVKTCGSSFLRGGFGGRRDPFVELLLV